MQLEEKGMREEYPKPVQLEDGTYTFKDKNGKLWKHRFERAYDFSEGLAPVKLEDGWTYVDKNGKLWEQRFKDVWLFREGLAKVQLKDGSYTFVDKNGKLWEQRFKNVYSFREGLALVQLKDESCTFVDKNGNICPENYVDDLRLIYKKPENFMTLPTEKFADKKFVEAAVKQVKISLAEMVASKDEIDDEYVKYVKEFLTNVKEKVEKENAKLEEIEKEKMQKEQKQIEKEEKKSKLIDEIKGFEL